ncbi:MAG TPA: proline dehydrogenase family protein [Thermoleophilia bacterium]|nr:proline dehydrogenase family protein [Thermoleophilia bacterium]
MPIRAVALRVNGARQTGVFDRLVSAAVPFVPDPIVRRLGAPYVAGTTLDDALRTVAALRAEGLEATLDILGEHVADRVAASAAADAYVETLDALERRGLESHLSVKLSGLGYGLGLDVAGEGVERIVRRAEELGSFVRLDMEDSSMTDDTLTLYRRLRAAGHERVGVVLQARLWRTPADVEALSPLAPSVRLCKGIYLEPPTVGLQDGEAIRRSFAVVLRRLLRGGSHVALATHDEALVVDALDALAEAGAGPERFEFQTLLGVRADLARLLARDHRVRVYVPFGVDSFAYAQRRLRENPQIAGYVARDVIRDTARAACALADHRRGGEGP